MVVDITQLGGVNMPDKNKNTQMTISEALDLLRKAWKKGIEIGTDFNQSKSIQRYVIANRIKTSRTLKNMTQEELSDKINANSLTYKGYENCKSDIPVVYLVRIANTLDVSLDYLTGRIDENEDYHKQIEERISKLENIVFSDDN